MTPDPVPGHVTPAAQLGRLQRAQLLLPRLTERGATKEQLEEAALLMVMLRDDFRDRVAGRAPHPVTGSMRPMR